MIFPMINSRTRETREEFSENQQTSDQWIKTGVKTIMKRQNEVKHREHRRVRNIHYINYKRPDSLLLGWVFEAITENEKENRWSSDHYMDKGVSNYSSEATGEPWISLKPSIIVRSHKSHFRNFFLNGSFPLLNKASKPNYCHPPPSHQPIT